VSLWSLPNARWTNKIKIKIMGNVSSSLTAGLGSQWRHVGGKEDGLPIIVHSEMTLLKLLGLRPSENRHKAARGTSRLIEAWHVP
jgi:hypothetical protein